VNWVLELDIRGFFDNLSHEWTMRFIEHRVADPRILQLITKWLKAGYAKRDNGPKVKQERHKGL
jgi:RNA-directed DNA polymerase